MDELTPERASEMLHGHLMAEMCTLSVLKGRWDAERWVIITKWVADQVVSRLHASGIRFFSKRISRPGDH